MNGRWRSCRWRPSPPTPWMSPPTPAPWRTESEPFPGAYRRGDGVAGRCQRADPGIAVPARGVVEEVQVDHQGPVGAAEVGPLGRVEQVPPAAVAGRAGGAVPQWQEKSAAVLLQPPHVDRRAQRRGQLDPPNEPQRRGAVGAGGQGQLRWRGRRPQRQREPEPRVVGPDRQAGGPERVTRLERALRVLPEELVAAGPPPRVPALGAWLRPHGRVELAHAPAPADQLKLGHRPRRVRGRRTRGWTASGPRSPPIPPRPARSGRLRETQRSRRAG